MQYASDYLFSKKVEYVFELETKAGMFCTPDAREVPSTRHITKNNSHASRRHSTMTSICPIVTHWSPGHSASVAAFYQPVPAHLCTHLLFILLITERTLLELASQTMAVTTGETDTYIHTGPRACLLYTSPSPRD